MVERCEGEGAFSPPEGYLEAEELQSQRRVFPT
jgi:hypothetical protein